MKKRAYLGAGIFDGTGLHEGKALLLDGTAVAGICDPDDLPVDCEVTTLTGGTVLPGFVDLQVNGGGGVMFNDETSLDGLVVIAKAHAATGTRALLPTLITDTPERTRAAVDAVEKAIAAQVPGIIGIHLEGPHLSNARKGAHDPALIRKMDQADEEFLVQAARRLANVMVTVAPENVTRAQIRRLAEAGVIVSLGHTDCSMAEAVAALDAGARCVTHLFNAMRQMGSREPGLVGAALRTKGVSAGLIADGIHVHPASMAVALDAKTDPGAIFLVTDAMATAGSAITEFDLNGRRVLRHDGRLTLEDGTLAGADLAFGRALCVMVKQVGLTKTDAFRMATTVPAQVLNTAFGYGRLAKSAKANAIWLDDSYGNVRAL